MLHQVMSLTLVATMTAATPSVPQGIPRGATINGTVKIAPTTAVFVGNPYIVYTALSDSVASVAIGTAMRDRIESKISASDFNVITRQTMNTDLVTSGFPPNAILTVGSATALGKQHNARIYITSVLSKGSGGLYSLVVRVWGLNEDAGQTIRMAQAAGQALPDFGGKAADAVMPIIRAHADAKSCVDLASSKPDKATESANKALKVIPNYGLAEYCLATMALKKDTAEAKTHLENTVKGDPQSLFAWSQLAIIHQLKNDSAAAVADYQSMLREDPTNSELAKEAVKVFRRYHRPDVLKALVAEQKKLDPTNTDWYDLSANGCIGDNDYKCALAELEQIWVLDSSRAYTLYFQKIISVAQEAPDTQAFLKWSRTGAKKFDTNIYLLSSLGRGYAWVGKTDSAVAQANRIMATDASQADQALIIIQGLVEAKQLRAAASFAGAAAKYGSESVKNQFGSLLANPGIALNSAPEPKDTALMSYVGSQMLAAGVTNAQLVTVGHYLVAAPMIPLLQPKSQSVRANKSCQEVKDYETFLNTLLPHLDEKVSGPIQSISDYGKQLQPLVKGEIALIPQLNTAFCKP
jgi:hypothetical protein